mmetsp:Transcript_51238/g.58875  ORF Transcript_51238/g.58875 Transcript_51238/m.58875 type:complete len:136 (+) Transcript_51238:54-461(+)
MFQRRSSNTLLLVGCISASHRNYVKGRVVDHTDLFFDFVERLDLVSVFQTLKDHSKDPVQIRDGVIAASVIVGHFVRTGTGHMPSDSVTDIISAGEGIAKLLRERPATPQEIERDIEEHSTEYLSQFEILKSSMR